MKIIFLFIPLLIAFSAKSSELKIYGLEGKPVSFLNNNIPEGFAVELADAIQTKLATRDPIKIVPWARGHRALDTVPNVMLLAIVRTDDRQHSMNFVGPLFVTRVTAYAIKGKLTEWQSGNVDLRTLRAGALRGSIFYSLPRARGYRLVDEVNSSETAAKMLMKHRFDLWFDGEDLYIEALRSAGYQKTDVEVALQFEPLDVCFAFSKGTSPNTIRGWDAALREMKRDGSFLLIYRKWMPAHQLPADVSVQH